MAVKNREIKTIYILDLYQWWLYQPVQYKLDLLHGFDGGEDFLQFANDESSQRFKPLDGLSHKHQNIQCCQLILISQKLN